MNKKVPIRQWLDQHMPGWSSMGRYELQNELQARWRGGEFKSLKTGAWCDPNMPVLVGIYYFWYVVPME